MPLRNSKTAVAGLFILVGIAQGCSDYEPVAKSECAKVVKHAQKVLGDFAPAYSELMTDCKKASDKERGCVMSANKKGELLQCM